MTEVCKRLIEVGTRDGDEILDAAGNGPPRVVNDSQGAVTVLDVVGDDAHGEQIVDLLDGNLLAAQLLPDAVEPLDAALDPRRDVGLFHLGFDLRAHFRTPGRRAEVRRGAPVRTIHNSIWSIGGTGNAEPYDPRPREGLDSLYTSSVLAIRPKTGEIACYYQYTPNDLYDVDGTDENVLADIQVGGKPRKVMFQTNKNGFLYVLDRTNCKLITAHPYVKVNWATSIDPETGRPVLSDVQKRFLAGEQVEIWPSRGTNAVPSAYDPNTGLIYASAWNVPRIQQLAPPKPTVPGGVSTGVLGSFPEPKAGDILGHFVAINPLTGEKKWEIPLTDLPSSAGMLATGGGLVFTGKLSGEFIALDENTGETLWQFKTSSSVNSTAITYTHKGRQYVTIASGLGGSLATRYAATKVPAGGSIWTFALMPK